MPAASRSTPNPKFHVARYHDNYHEKVFKQPGTRFTMLDLMQIFRDDPVAAEVGCAYVQALTDRTQVSVRNYFDDKLAVGHGMPWMAAVLRILPDLEDESRDIIIGKEWKSPFATTPMPVNAVALPYTGAVIESEVFQRDYDAPTRVGRALLNDLYPWPFQPPQEPPQ